MHWLKSIVYGIVCGLSEFLPISSSGHQVLFTDIFGSQIQNPVSELLIHISLLVAVVIANYSAIMRLRREAKIGNKRRGTGHNYNSLRSQYDIRLIKNAALPLVVLLLLRPLTATLSNNALVLALCFVLNGVILFLPTRLLQSNKDAKNMSAADALLIGLSGGFSVFAGISRIGASVSVATIRGADHKEALNWCLLLSIPALIVQIVLDFFTISSGIMDPYAFGHYLLIIAGALTGGYLGIFMIRSILSKAGFFGFAFYSWGAAMLTLVLYMIV